MTFLNKISSANLFRFSFQRFFSSHQNKICACGAALPGAGKIAQLFEERILGKLPQIVACPLYHSSSEKNRNCKLLTVLEQTAEDQLTNFNDVIYRGFHFVTLSALTPLPKGDFGDFRGDHGKQIAGFLAVCRQKKYIGEIGAIVDVGGQNTSTVERISEAFENNELPCLIVDRNACTPALASETPHIKYAVSDALEFFLIPDYNEKTAFLKNKKPILFVFNNILNVLKAKDAWELLAVTWNRLNPGDYLVISGLAPEELQHRPSLKKECEIEGIVEFHDRAGFYKSALSENFSACIIHRLHHSNILSQEIFSFPIKIRPHTATTNIQGRRLLTLKKL